MTVTVLATDQITLADVTDAYSVTMTKETYVFPGEDGHAIPSNTDTTISAKIGAADLPCYVILSEITKPSGVTILKDDNEVTPTLTISVDDTVTTGGVVTIPIHIGDVTFIKDFTFSLSFSGTPGTPGRGIASSTVAYQVSSSGIIVPSGPWLSSPPEIPPGQYLWTRARFVYTDETEFTTYSVGVAGMNGSPAPLISLTATSQIFKSPSGGGSTVPPTIIISGSALNTTISVWEYSVNGGSFSDTLPAGVSRAGNVVTIDGSLVEASTISVRMSDDEDVSDTLTIAKVYDGIDGPSYMVLLTNEAHVFPGDLDNALPGEASTNVIAYKNTTLQVVTIDTITGHVDGLTTSIVNNNTANASVTITVTTDLIETSGVLKIPMTVDGRTFEKDFAWSVTRRGAEGRGIVSSEIRYQKHTNGVTPPTGTWLETPPGLSPGDFLWTRTILTYTEGLPSTSYSVGMAGANGQPGVSITGTNRYYRLSLTQPAKPTTDPPPSPWTLTEPEYVEGSTDFLWTVDLTLLSDDSFLYSAVSKSSSYEAAKLAYQKALQAADIANNAQITANGKNKVVRSVDNPSNPELYVMGDQWWKYVGTEAIALWIHDGTDWIQTTIEGGVLSNLDAGTITVGYLSGDRIEANSISSSKLNVENGFIKNAMIGDAEITSAKIASINVSKLMVGDWQNYAVDAAFKEPLNVNWTGGANVSISRFTNEPNRLLIVSSNSGNTHSYNSMLFEVVPGEEYYLETEALMYSNYANKNKVRLALRVLNHNKQSIGWFGPSTTEDLTAGSWIKFAQSITIPENARYAQVNYVVYTNGVANQTYGFRNPKVYRRNTGEVLVDGSINAQKLTASAVTTEKMTIGALILNAIANGDFEDQTAGWGAANSTGSLTYTSDKGSGGVGAGRYYMILNRATGAAQAQMNSTKLIPVYAGERLAWSTSFWSSSADQSFYYRLRWRDALGVDQGYTDLVNGVIGESAWIKKSGIVQVPANNNIKYVEAQIINYSPSVPAHHIAVDYVRLSKAIEGDMLVNGSVDATKLSVDQAFINALTVNTNLWANKIYANMMQIAGLNLASDPTFTSGVPWGAAVQVIAGGFSGSNRIYVAAGSGQRGAYCPPPLWTPVRSDASQLRLRYRVLAGGPLPASGVGLFVRSYNRSGVTGTAYGLLNPTAIASGYWTIVEGLIPNPITDEYPLMAYGFFSNANFASSASFSDPWIAEAVSGELVVDGSITATKIQADALNGKTITGSLVRTAASGARIEMRNSDNTIRAYNAAGTNTVTIDGNGSTINGGTITGSLVRTAASGARIEMRGSDNTLRAFNASGTNTVTIDGNGATINGGTITGSNIFTSWTHGSVRLNNGELFSVDSSGQESVSVREGLIEVSSAAQAIEITSSGINVWGEPVTVELSAAGVDITGPGLFIEDATTTSSANAFLQSSRGYRKLVRSTSIRSAKSLIEDVKEKNTKSKESDDISIGSFLALRPRTWYDNGQMRSVNLDPESADEKDCVTAGLRRIPGFIAEEVEKIDPLYCTYDDTTDGPILSGVAYDRLAVAIHQILIDHENRMRAIEGLPPINPLEYDGSDDDD